jgi:uncharacterized protein YutE (UPF0331/DUF86 family)
MEKRYSTLAMISKLEADGLSQLSMLLCCATFEALARSLMFDRVAAPQSPASVKAKIAEQGHLTPDQANRLRELAKKRSRLIHGDLGMAVSAQDMSFLILVVKVLSLAAFMAPT